MDEFSEHLNDILVETFHSILKVEEKMLKRSEDIDVSIKELHLLESIGRDKTQKKSISDIALDLNITLPSVTVAINKLVKRGYVEKIKSENDGRVVFVTLTNLGRKIDIFHKYFHDKMVKEVAKDLTADEKAAMLKGIIKLNIFFKKRLLSMED